MKQITLIAAAAAMILASCAGNPEGKKADTKDAVEAHDHSHEGVVAYTIDAAQSKLVWTGTKVSGAHTGTVDFKSGELKAENDALVGGKFVLDLTTINSTDLEGEYKANLDGHLKAEDFFNVAEFPEATLEITEVKAGATAGDVTISANLTIRGISKNITFDAKVEELTHSTIKTKANFNIVRADWGVNYEGKKDDLISKEINFDVTIVANH